VNASAKAEPSRLLIIDDSANIHADIRKVLTRENTSALAQMEADIFGEGTPDPGSAQQFDIDSAYQGEDGVSMAEHALREGRPYAVAFVDMRMPPGMDGLATIVRLWEVDPDIQVVICSAYSDYSWAEIMSRVGHNDRLLIVRKPFDNIEVLQLAHTLATKWHLQRQVQSQLRQLAAVAATQARELNESQALFRLLIENSSDLISVFDQRRRRVYSSPAYQRMLGYTAEELQAAPAFALIHPDDRSAIDRALDDAWAGRKALIALRKRHKDGAYVSFQVSVAAAETADGGKRYAIATARRGCAQPVELAAY
jgi:PAS domain S-box-containing protein